MGFDAHVGIKGDHISAKTFADVGKPDDPDFDVYLTNTALEHVTDSTPHLIELLDLHTFAHNDALEIGDLTVVPFPVEHARPRFDTVGFAVSHGENKIVYAPDMWEFIDDSGYKNADLLFAEGAALFRTYGHGDEADLRAALADADAERTILINLNEHLQRMTTHELRQEAQTDGYELGADFATYQL
jgi:phosphoribosyl 1,2-cyclic phosphodiesterase